ncbi:MAG: ABC transporter permease, partial [Burkholderiaceae bacterium]
MSGDLNPNTPYSRSGVKRTGPVPPVGTGLLTARAGSGLALFALVVALVIIAPVMALVAVSGQPGSMMEGATDGGTWSHLLQTVLPTYALTSVLLVTGVCLLVLLMGVGTAWMVAAWEFPGRSMLEVGLILPLAMPAFVMAYAYTEALDTSGLVQTTLRSWSGWDVGEYWFPQVRSLPGAALFLALALYPYVYMLARNAFAERNPNIADAARSLGLSPVRVWWSVTWPVARPAIAAGIALVTMETLADFGTVSFFAVDTFSAGIYRAWQSMGDRVTAAQLALILLVVVIVLVRLERRQRGRMAFHARGQRPAQRAELRGTRAVLATLACALPVFLGFVLPTGLLLRSWWMDGASVDARLLQWMTHTGLLSGLAVIITVPGALAVAYALRLSSARWLNAAAGVSGSGYAIPGVVMGVGLLAVIAAWDNGPGHWSGLLLGGSAFAVVYAYCARFFAVAQQGLEASLKRIS